jgi:hypothetical protein
VNFFSVFLRQGGEVPAYNDQGGALDPGKGVKNHPIRTPGFY